MVEIKEEDIEIINRDKPDHNIRYLYVHTHGGFSKELCDQLKQQILQDHEDAKKWQKLCNQEACNIGEHLNAQKDRQIVKRLEERIDHWKGFRANFWSHSDVKRELQKILEGEK